MEKLSMCRICLVENVRMYVVTNKSLQEMYEKLIDVPFVTEDSRPMLACVFCCTKLKQCCQLQRKCLEAEEQFAQILNEGNEQKPLTKQGHLGFAGGFIISPIENISIVEECQTECDVIKQELTVVCEEQCDVELKVEHLSEDLKLEIPDESYQNVEDITAAHHSESDSDVPLMEDKIEPEEVQEVSKKTQRARVTKRAAVAEKPKLHSRKRKLEDSIPDDHPMNQLSNSTITRTTKVRSPESVAKFKESITTISQSSLVRSNHSKQLHQIHTGEKPYKCEICHSFGRYSDSGEHFRKPTGEKSYKCEVCQRSFGSSSVLKRHSRIHTGEKPYKCEICQQSFARNSNLVVHLRTHSGEKPFKCESCERNFSHSHDLKRHIRIHTGEKPYKCDLCQRSFSAKSTLRNHVRIHAPEKPFKCEVCQRSFGHSSLLKSHSRVHTGEKPYKCEICQQSFARNSNLEVHFRKHSGEKPFKCELCERSFSHSSDLKRHIRIHTGEKPYKCDVCQRSFSAKSTLRNHFRIHAHEKPFKCEVCQRSFGYYSDMKRHSRIHTGEKPYKCDICQCNFFRRDELNRHNNRTHTDKHVK